MTSLLVLIPVSLGMGLVGLCAFFWAMRHNQFDDPEGNAWRVIIPEEQMQAECTSQSESSRHDNIDPTLEIGTPQER